ncbi:MAG TPA: SMC family ATPase [Phototrophicaceae bacterium]|nr:SMC family ATPase [Phototrophicaceae bacterium]
MLNNFLSHKNTRLEFDPGITVFVGHNGSGKSSIIDSITFALFDEHTRKSNRNLVTKGIDQTLSDESGSFVVMDFSVGCVDYKVQRQINSVGHLVSAKLEQLKQNDSTMENEKNISIYRPIVSGERKQRGESVIGEVESILGINYPKLQIASIIQQGEINKIIDSQPKEFKELLNNMMGLDKLDKSFTYMHSIIYDFRNLLREKTGGYDDNYIKTLKNKTEENKNKIKTSRISLENVYSDLFKRSNEMSEIEKEIEDLVPKMGQLQEVKTLEATLLKYLKEKSISLNIDIEKNKKMLSEVKNAFSLLHNKDEVSITLQMIQCEKEELHKKMNNIEGELGKLNGFTECAKKIQIKDGKCPVCNSKIIAINDMFDISHIKKELDKKQKEKTFVSSDLTKLNAEELNLRKKEKNIISAEKTLSSYGISPDFNVGILEQKISSLNANFQIASKINFGNYADANLLLYRVDDYSANLIDVIMKMRSELVDIDLSVLNQKKLIRNKLSSEIIGIQNQKAVLEKSISNMENEITEFDKLTSELHSASKFISDLEKIRSMVFNRDGVVSSSLRTWALNLISVKSSDYINTFNVGISKISLVERPREIKVLCYGKRGEIDIISLSGGEKVAVSLALRLGIAYLMGSSKIDFIVLDEPTSNLDEERRRSFVKIISDVFSKGVGPLSQMIIITHDEEIFENSEIEQIYKFSMSDRGSIVTPV